MIETSAKPAKISIFINAKEYDAKPGPISGQQLRSIAKPPIPPDKELWLDIEDAQDELVPADAQVELRDGMRFFSDSPAITIRIDREEHEVHKRKMTGLQLRSVPSPDVAADRDLWLDVPDKRDRKIQDEDIVRLHDGIRFFTAPGRINPGR